MTMPLDGYFSLVQFQADPDRAEGANVGVLLFCPARGLIEGRFAERFERAARFFGSEAVHAQRLSEWTRSLVLRLREDAPATAEEFRAATRRESGPLVVGLPRMIAVSDPVADLERLFAKLIGERPRSAREGRTLPQIEALFANPTLAQRIHRNVSVRVLGQSFRVPYEWTNGHPNLVLPQRFEADDNRANTTAAKLAVKGHRLWTKPDDHVQRKLVVVPCFATGTPDPLRARVGEVLADLDVEIVPQERLDQYAARIRTEAH
jgi:hypothetical protein